VAVRGHRIVVDISDMETVNQTVNREQNHERSAENMRTTTSATPTNTPAAHFLSDRYAYRARPDFLPELLVFGIIVVTTAWPILLLVNAIATGR
jgi:hypothetical protein